MLTEMVLPNRLGVETSTSWDRWSQPLTSSIRWWSFANSPCFSRFQKILAHARMKLSWNMRWWNDRCHPRLSRASSPCLHFCMRWNPLQVCCSPAIMQFSSAVLRLCRLISSFAFCSTTRSNCAK